MIANTRYMFIVTQGETQGDPGRLEYSMYKAKGKEKSKT